MSPQNTIYFLVGPRASGKTTLGRLLAGALDLCFIDTDIYIREKDGLSVAQVVEREGWEGFRRRESAALRETARPGRVVATGGGMVLSPDNRKFMRRNGTVFYLAASPETLADRLSRHPNADLRPSLTGRPVAQEIRDVLAERAALYEAVAHHALDASREMDSVLEEALRFCQIGR